MVERLALWIAIVLSTACGVAQAKDAAPAAADPVLEARLLRIAAELRCLVCQNQTIADSHADLAQDLRRQDGRRPHFASSVSSGRISRSTMSGVSGPGWR